MLHHIGYWVDDLADAVDRATRTLGVGPFLAHPHVRFDSFQLADGRAISDPDYFDHSAVFAAWGPVVLEFDEIHSIAPDLAGAYQVGAGGLGHVSWLADDLDAESRRLDALGCRLIHTATSGQVAVAWHDGGGLFPHPIEVHRAGPAIRSMHARLTALAAGWDGTEPVRPMAAA
ncbi:MAG TPA: VOC family protein [Jatrophihabitantaceae bacterium]|jgi:catechol 2,3-dioxygenase-like lactoylglutathione lyase family enzyme